MSKNTATKGKTTALASLYSAPIDAANKTFLASLGLISVVQSEVSSRIDALAKDGETVRDQYRASFADLQKNITGKVSKGREQIVERIQTITKSVANRFSVAADNGAQSI